MAIAVPNPGPFPRTCAVSTNPRSSARAPAACVADPAPGRVKPQYQGVNTHGRALRSCVASSEPAVTVTAAFKIGYGRTVLPSVEDLNATSGTSSLGSKPVYGFG